MHTYLVETDSLTPVAIPDLQLFISREKPAFITQAQFRSSLILTQLKALGKVRVSLSNGARVVRSPPGPTTKVSSKPIGFQPPSPKGIKNPPPPPQRPAHVVTPRTARPQAEAPEEAAGARNEGSRGRGGRPRKGSGEPEKG